MDDQSTTSIKHRNKILTLNGKTYININDTNYMKVQLVTSNNKMGLAFHCYEEHKEERQWTKMEIQGGLQGNPIQSSQIFQKGLLSLPASLSSYSRRNRHKLAKGAVSASMAPNTTCYMVCVCTQMEETSSLFDWCST